MLCNGGCCCCSCCLHSLGGLIGAATVSVKNLKSPGASVIMVYWTTLAVAAVFLLIFVAAAVPEGPVIAALLLLPLAQLAASIIAWIWVGNRKEESPNKKAELRLLGKITLWSFLGVVAGVVAMVVGFQMLG